MSVNLGPGPCVLVLDLSSPTSLRFGLGTFFWTVLGPCVAFALLFLFISYKPHFTSATKKERKLMLLLVLDEYHAILTYLPHRYSFYHAISCPTAPSLPTHSLYLLVLVHVQVLVSSSWTSPVHYHFGSVLEHFFGPYSVPVPVP